MAPHDHGHDHGPGREHDLGAHALVGVALVTGEWRSAELRRLVPEVETAAAWSATNTTGRSALAWADVRVGIDLEAVRPRPRLERLATRLLLPDEHERWRAAPDPLVALLQHWTRFEAYVKAIGRGVAAGYHARPGVEWAVIDLDLPPGHVGAIAVEHPEPVVMVRTVTAPGTSG